MCNCLFLVHHIAMITLPPIYRKHLICIILLLIVVKWMFQFNCHTSPVGDKIQFHLWRKLIAKWLHFETENKPFPIKMSSCPLVNLSTCWQLVLPEGLNIRIGISYNYIAIRVIIVVCGSHLTQNEWIRCCAKIVQVELFPFLKIGFR